jgi:hypothetical protein
MHISGTISRPSAIPAAPRGAIRLTGSSGGFARSLTRWRGFSLDYFRSIEAGAAMAVMRHALARRIENALARFWVFREGRERHPFDEGEVGAGVPVAASICAISLSRSR